MSNQGSMHLLTSSNVTGNIAALSAAHLFVQLPQVELGSHHTDGARNGQRLRHNLLGGLQDSTQRVCVQPETLHAQGWKGWSTAAAFVKTQLLSQRPGSQDCKTRAWVSPNDSASKRFFISLTHTLLAQHNEEDKSHFTAVR